MAACLRAGNRSLTVGRQDSLGRWRGGSYPSRSSLKGFDVDRLGPGWCDVLRPSWRPWQQRWRQHRLRCSDCPVPCDVPVVATAELCMKSRLRCWGPQPPGARDGMGNLRVTKKGIRLEGISEFLLPLYVKEIHSRKDSPLVLQSDRNVTVNARNHMGQLTGQLTVGADAVEAQCKRFEVRASEDGRVLFSADEDEITIGAEKLKVTGTEGAVFGHSVETPHVRAEPSQDLRLESPTRSLIMEAPRGVQVSAAAGDFKATCRKELHLQSTEGEIFLNADTIRLGNLPTGSFSSSSPSSSSSRQTVYELCVCPNGKLYLSPAGVGSTCQSSSNICLWN
ncbi:zeta-sarcoglycan [Carlito syrichta]|uniref:Zeta-sarcoglycan n=1 Tax=Carlito syrichta TaxID=1868482 RepID=A0A3Q0DG45_CARSF|nr:zeta-sarcoglycan [Carlito syrichta]